MMALAMLPPPMKAMWCEVFMESVSGLPGANGSVRNCRFCCQGFGVALQKWTRCSS
jgi:hypothetical protein